MQVAQLGALELLMSDARDVREALASQGRGKVRPVSLSLSLSHTHTHFHCRALSRSLALSIYLSLSFALCVCVYVSVSLALSRSLVLALPTDDRRWATTASRAGIGVARSHHVRSAPPPTPPRRHPLQRPYSGFNYKLFIQPFCKSRFPHKSVNLSSI